jgi:hypothetical protein
MTKVETILFPFTFVGLPQVELLLQIWPQITIYRPLAGQLPNGMQKLCEQGLLSVRSPAFNQVDQLKIAQKRLTAWGEQVLGPHGPKASQIKALQADIPFFEETYPSSIVADLKKPIPDRVDTTSPDHLALQTRLFLSMAQELDSRLHETDQELDALQAMEARLQQALHGQPGLDDLRATTGDHERFASADPGSHLTHQRLKAWARLVLEDRPHRHQQPALVLVTTSPTVFDCLDELDVHGDWLSDEICWPLASPGAHAKPGDWRHAWNDYWHSLCVSNDVRRQLSAKPPLPSRATSATLKLHLKLASNLAPPDFFSHLLAPQSQSIGDCECLHTVFILATQ